MCVIRKFVFSCSIFGGFTVELNITEKSTLENCVIEATKVLKDTLNVFNLYELTETLKLKKYHIHDKKIIDILTKNEIVYICNCS